MTNFIVHIGDGKCGSSSIQRAMYAARADLKSNGLVYETSTPKGGHFGLVTLAGRRTRGSVAVQRTQAKESVQMIKALVKKGDQVILSGESFVGLLPDQVEKILKTMGPKIGTLDVIAYVRSPQNQYLSIVQQTLKGDRRFPRPDQYCRPIDKFLRSWKEDPNVRNMYVHKFDRASLFNGDVVQDFAKALTDMSGKTVTLESQDANQSLTAEQMIVLQQFRRDILPDFDGKLHRESGGLINFFQVMNGFKPMGLKPMLHPSALQAVCRGNAEVVANINAMFPEVALETAGDETVSTDYAPWLDSEDVSTILEHYTTTDVDHLTALVPHLSPALRDGMTAQAAAAITRFIAPDCPHRTAQLGTLKRFWNRNLCTEAVEALDALK